VIVELTEVDHEMKVADQTAWTDWSMLMIDDVARVDNSQ
jgi:hypothetical protein